MTKTISNRAARTALMLGITLGAAGAMTAISTPLTATDAQAFGLGDITGAAKKVGGAVKDGVKKGVSVARDTHKAVKDYKKQVRDAVRGASAEVTLKGFGYMSTEAKALYEKAKGTYDREKHMEDRRELDEFVRENVGYVTGYDRVKENVKGKIKGKAKDAARKAREKALTGKLTPVPPRNRPLQPGQWGQNGNPMAQGLVNRTRKNRAPVQGITLRNTKPAPGLKSQITLQKGTPAGRNTIPIVQKGTKAPVQGITKENLKPAKGQTPKITLQGRPLGNDRSMQGRPVGKANTKTVRKGSARNVPPHRGSKTPEARPRTYPNYPPKKPSYPGYPGKRDASSVTKQGKAKSNRSLAGRPVGGRKPLGNDRSLAGRPVGGRKPIGQDRSNKRRPTGITRQNLQPRQKTKRIMQTKQKFTRNLSRNKGGSGRNGRKFQNKRQNFKTQMKRSNTKRNLRKGGRRNRRG